MKKLLYLSVFIILLVLTKTSYSNQEFFFKTDTHYKNVVVQKVISTDTIIIKNHSQNNERIKLIGLRAEEHHERKKDIERDSRGFIREEPISATTPIEDRAFDFVENLLLNNDVRIEFDKSKKDTNHDTVGYVYLNENNTFVNEEILKQGFANLRITPPNTKHAKTLRAAYKEARQEKRGLQGQ